MPLTKQNYILLTIDVEDWFQVENFKHYIPFATWSERELRVERNTNRLLDLFDSIAIENSTHSDKMHYSKVTFFILGWIAERVPQLVNEIVKRGHEVASHGFNHHLCSHESIQTLNDDLRRSKAFLEDIIGTEVVGYRAPSFSINNDVLRIIRNCGYGYDSSYNSFGMNSRYGQVNLNGYEKKGIAIRLANGFYELPISNVRFNKTIFPLGGGGYFRLLPSPIFRLGIKNILNRDNAYLFYMHPWEIDAGQPRVDQAALFFKFRHYVNLSTAAQKLSTLIKRFNLCRFITCRDYIHLQTGGA